MVQIPLIHSEQQFVHLRSTMEPYAGCVDPTQWPKLINPLVLILTTQRTGSTLLCQDIASAWQLPYQPTESFVPPLTGFFNNAIPPQALTQQLANTLTQHNTAPCNVFKLMADYIGWLGFFCCPKDQALSASYTELSARFLQLLQSNCPDGFQLIQLERKHKLKQAISRLFNCMGLPTHIRNDEAAIRSECESPRVAQPQRPDLVPHAVGGQERIVAGHPIGRRRMTSVSGHSTHIQSQDRPEQ